MGYYINENSKGEFLPAKGKASALIADGALEVPIPEIWKEGLVCVVDNVFFDAAAYAYSAKEMEEFKDMSSNKRKRVWLYYPNAKKLSGYL